jgi:uncharacterized protein DUF6941
MVKADSSPQKPLPQCKALLLCEAISEDATTGQLSLHKLIEIIQFRAFPAESPPLAIFVQLYDGIGRYQLAVEIRDLAENTSMSVAAFSSLEFPERLAKMDIVLPVEFLRLPRAGRYEFALLLDGEELATQSIDADLEDGGRTT